MNRSQSIETKPGRGTDEISAPPMAGTTTATTATIQARDPRAINDRSVCFFWDTRPNSMTVAQPTVAVAARPEEPVEDRDEPAQDRHRRLRL